MSVCACTQGRTDPDETTHHHVTGRHDVGAGARLADGLLAELIDGDVVQDFSVLHDAVVALVGVGVQGDVGADDAVGVLVLDHAERAGDDALRVVGLHAEVGLEVVRDLGEQDKGADADLEGLADLAEHRVE